MERLDEFQRRLSRLARIPVHPRSLTGPANWLNGILLFADYLASVPPRMTRLTAPLRKYPKDFEKVRFPSHDGTILVGWLGRSKRPGPRPGLILLPGLFTSKDNNRIRARSVRILREWGFHILTLDLRGIGESERRYSTPGLREADDIRAAIEWFRQAARPEPVHLYAESLAASAAVLACGQAGLEGYLLVDGNVLAMSPYGEPGGIVDRFSGASDWRDRSFGPVKTFFKLILRLTGTGHRDFKDYVQAAADSYGIGYEELIAQSSAMRVVAECRSPTLVIHSRDDEIVPASDADALAEAARPNPHVKVWLLPWGNHCLYEMADPDWYWSALETFFGASA